MANKFTVFVDALYDPRPGQRQYGLVCRDANTGEKLRLNVWEDKSPEQYRPHVQSGAPVTINAQPWYKKDGSGIGGYNATSIANDNMQQVGQAAPHVGTGQAPPPAAPNNRPLAQSDQAEDIFVTGIVGRALGSGQFGTTDIDALTKAAVQAWRNRHQTSFPAHTGHHQQPVAGGGDPGPQGPQDYGFNDDIPPM